MQTKKRNQRCISSSPLPHDQVFKSIIQPDRHLVQLRNVLRQPAYLRPRQQPRWNTNLCAGSYLACPSDSFSQGLQL